MTLLKACFIRRRQLPSRWFLSFCNSCLVSISPFPCTPLSLSDPPIQKEVVKSYIFTFLIRELWISKLVKPLQDVPSNFYIKSYHHCCRLYQIKIFQENYSSCFSLQLKCLRTNHLGNAWKINVGFKLKNISFISIFLFICVDFS